MSNSDKLKKIEKIKGVINSRPLRILDIVLSVSTLGYGAYLFSVDGAGFIPYALLASGLIGCIACYYRPSVIIDKMIKKSIINKRSTRNS